jgi:2-polyprenyl-3-methyl-5-hydroxy-6-metoxy-1,4-benzoquinol methylase
MREAAVTVCNICGASVDRGADRRWRKDGYDILKCPRCGTFFRAQLPSADDLRQIYSGAYFLEESEESGGQGYKDYLGEERNHRANSLARLIFLEEHGRRGKLLDVGCAAGFFLDEARKRGWSGSGVELAPTMAAYARTQLALDVREEEFARFNGEPQTFDAVTMWDYIEHSTDPAGDLRRAAQLLQPGGLLALSTGDASSVAARISGRRWHLLTPRHHNFFFTRASLQRAVRDAGFEVVSAKYLSSRYSVQYLFHKLRTLADVRALRSASDALGRSRLGEVAVPLNLFDIVTVVGRRSST